MWNQVIATEIVQNNELKTSAERVGLENNTFFFHGFHSYLFALSFISVEEIDKNGSPYTTLEYKNAENILWVTYSLAVTVFGLKRIANYFLVLHKLKNIEETQKRNRMKRSRIFLVNICELYCAWQNCV